MPTARRRSRGQSMAETSITVALVAIATLSLVTLFGNNLRALFGVSGDALSGKTSVANRAVAPPRITDKTLRTFGESTSGGGDGAGGTTTAPEGAGSLGGGHSGGGENPQGQF